MTPPLNTVTHGDSFEVLKGYPDNTFDSCVTDPPYGLGNKDPGPEEILSYLQGSRLDTGGDFMGRDWEIPPIALWKEVYRVLKPGAYLAAFAGTRTVDLISIGIRMAGFENRDTFAAEFGPSLLGYIYSTGFPKSVSVDKQLEKKGASPEEIAKWKGYGTALKPAWEPILIFRKPLEEETLVAQIRATGTGAINIEECRVRHASPEDLAAHQHSVEAVKNTGGKFRGSWKNSSDLSGANDVSYNGRWPPNVLFQHTDACEIVAYRTMPAPVINAYQGGVMLGKAEGREYVPSGPQGVEKVPVYRCHPACPSAILNEQGNSVDPTGVSRYFPSFQPLEAPFRYSQKANQKDATNDGLVENNHPTKKSTALMAWLIKLVTPAGGLTLDPFCGSGSTLVAAAREGFDFLGVEKDSHFAQDVASVRANDALIKRAEATENVDLFSLMFGE